MVLGSLPRPARVPLEHRNTATTSISYGPAWRITPDRQSVILGIAYRLERFDSWTLGVGVMTERTKSDARGAGWWQNTY